MKPTLQSVWVVYDDGDGYPFYRVDDEDTAKEYADQVNDKANGYRFMGTARVARYDLATDSPSPPDAKSDG